MADASDWPKWLDEQLPDLPRWQKQLLLEMLVAESAPPPPYEDVEPRPEYL